MTKTAPQQAKSDMNWTCILKVTLLQICALHFVKPYLPKAVMLSSRPSTCLTQSPKPWTNQNPNSETMRVSKLFSFLDATPIQILTNDFRV